MRSPFTYHIQENFLKRLVVGSVIRGAGNGSPLLVERRAVILGSPRVATLAIARILALVRHGAIEKAAPAHTRSHPLAAAAPIPEAVLPGAWLPAGIHLGIMKTS